MSRLPLTAEEREELHREVIRQGHDEKFWLNTYLPRLERIAARGERPCPRCLGLSPFNCPTCNSSGTDKPFVPGDD